MSARPYTKLPGVSYGAGGRSRLWLGDDHLLEVHSMIFAERYRRYPFAEIRAVVVEPTSTATMWTALSGGVLGLALLGVGAAWWGTTQTAERSNVVGLSILASTIGVLALVALIVLVINLWRGPSCRCLLQTAAGLTPLTTPTRQAKARKIIERLTPEIEKAQELSPR